MCTTVISSQRWQHKENHQSAVRKHRSRPVLAGRSAFPDQATAYRAVFRWANRYNTRRRHSAMGNITPNTYETAYAATASATLTEAA